MKGLLTLGIGIALTAVGVIAMKKASKKANDIIENHVQTKEVIEECVSEEYTEEDRANDHVINNVQTTIQLVKNYTLPLVSTITGGCFVIVGSYNTFNRPITK